MIQRTVGYFLCLVLAVLAFGCGGEDPPPNENPLSTYLKPFSQNGAELVVGTRFTLKVRFSEPVTVRTYVDITNSHADYIQMDSSSLLFTPGEQEETIGATGLKATNEVLEIDFVVRGKEKDKVTWTAKVVDPV
ncbi:MAG: hypothetical protein V1754_14655 [Pseudomonadota bacterium]